MNDKPMRIDNADGSYFEIEEGPEPGTCVVTHCDQEGMPIGAFVDTVADLRALLYSIRETQMLGEIDRQIT